MNLRRLKEQYPKAFYPEPKKPRGYDLTLGFPADPSALSDTQRSVVDRVKIDQSAAAVQVLAYEDGRVVLVNGACPKATPIHPGHEAIGRIRKTIDGGKKSGHSRTKPDYTFMVLDPDTSPGDFLDVENLVRVTHQVTTSRK